MRGGDEMNMDRRREGRQGGGRCGDVAVCENGHGLVRRQRIRREKGTR